MFFYIFFLRFSGTGQGKHSDGDPVLKEGVAQMLARLPFRSRETLGGFYVRAWKDKLNKGAPPKPRPKKTFSPAGGW